MSYRGLVMPVNMNTNRFNREKHFTSVTFLFNYCPVQLIIAAFN